MQINVQATQERKRKVNLGSDVAYTALSTKTPAEINQWIDSNVTDLASAKVVLKLLTRAVIHLLRAK